MPLESCHAMDSYYSYLFDGLDDLHPVAQSIRFGSAARRHQLSFGKAQDQRSSGQYGLDRVGRLSDRSLILILPSCVQRLANARPRRPMRCLSDSRSLWRCAERRYRYKLGSTDECVPYRATDGEELRLVPTG